LLNGKRQILRIAMPGDLLGFQSDLDAPSEVTIRSVSPMVLCAFPRARFVEHVHSHPSLMDSLNRMNAYYIGLCEAHLVGLGRKSARERVANLLMELWSRARQLGDMIGFDEQQGMEFPLSQEDMGDAIGISAVHVNRTLRELRDEKLIQLDARHLMILDERALGAEGHFDPSVIDAREAFLT
ncbi:MAG: Crp/Fnr family transcriptional regulator, partial [Gammaproteobacteria bacterium]